MMIKIYDNLFPQSLVNRIENTLSSSEFYWFALDNLSIGDQYKKFNFNLPENYKLMDTYGMTKPFWYNDTIYDPYDIYMMSRMIIDYFCEESGIELNQILRIKVNLLTQNPNGGFDEMTINSPHIDHYNDHHVLVYYVNDCDGDSILFNEKWENQENGEEINLSIKERVTPKRGRLLHFNGRYFHTSQNPINSKTRMIININFI